MALAVSYTAVRGGGDLLLSEAGGGQSSSFAQPPPARLSGRVFLECFRALS